MIKIYLKMSEVLIEEQKKIEEQNKNQSKFEAFKSFILEQGNIIHQKTGIPSKYVIIILGICIASVVIGYLDQYITCLVGIVFPTIYSIRALETPDPDDDKQWLTYWVVFGIFTFVDLFSGFFLKFIPFYFILKILFLIWLFLPNFKGAARVYNCLIYPLFNKYRSQIDELEKGVSEKVTQFGITENGVKNTLTYATIPNLIKNT